MICIKCHTIDPIPELEITGEHSKIHIHRQCLKKCIYELISKKEEYKEILKRIITYEEEVKDDKYTSQLTQGKFSVSWNWRDIGVFAPKLNKLVSEKVIIVLFSSRSETRYALTDRDTTKEVLDEIESECETVEEERTEE